MDPPIFSLSQGGNPPLDPPIFSLSQGGHPPVDLCTLTICTVHSRYCIRLYSYEYCTVGIFEELVRYGTVQYCNKLCAAPRDADDQQQYFIHRV